MPQNSQRPPGVAVSSRAQLSGQKKTTTKAKLNPTSSALKGCHHRPESMDITQAIMTDSTSNLFPEITETIVDISIRSALHYLQYKEILLPDNILVHSIPAELYTACLTFGQLHYSVSTPGPTSRYNIF
ncbi:hypothetical protein CEXT_462741 [Caerostris extrusa]|uniref:Uncharacterized protein n=1 Tax=Caerostris extrusa TaxID=172846 RepID=A0AAV4RIR4_CAEEX|nr:hypothetical protein CEXT_462741 [Caerostris extrusa]